MTNIDTLISKDLVRNLKEIHSELQKDLPRRMSISTSDAFHKTQKQLQEMNLDIQSNHQ